MGNLNEYNNNMEIIDCNWICIDIANGYLDGMVSFCKRVREQYPNKINIKIK